MCLITGKYSIWLPRWLVTHDRKCANDSWHNYKWSNMNHELEMCWVIDLDHDNGTVCPASWLGMAQCASLIHNHTYMYHIPVRRWSVFHGVWPLFPSYIYSWEQTWRCWTAPQMEWYDRSWETFQQWRETEMKHHTTTAQRNSIT